MRPLRLLASSVILGLLAANSCFQGSDREFGPIGGGPGPDGSAGSGGSGAATGGSGASTGGSSGSGSGGSPDASLPPGDCTTDADCDDGDICNGTETCDDGVCADAASAAPDDTACTRLRLVKNATGGFDEREVDGLCRTGECREECQTLADCDDENPCTGQETCNAVQGVCAYGEAIACNDNSECTTDTCDPVNGPAENNFCLFALVDADGDGHAPVEIGACGTDCDDDNELAYIGAQQLCGEADTDCDPATTGTEPRWYPDCDNDGYAEKAVALAEPIVIQCDAPTDGPTGCLTTGAWTLRSPLESARLEDCDDRDAERFPIAEDCATVNGVDNNCDAVVDGYMFYADCDADGYAASNVGTPGADLGSGLCAPPALDPSCNGIPGGSWVSIKDKYPEGPSQDCNDFDIGVSPGAGYQSLDDPDIFELWDYNCNERVEQEFTTTGVDPNATCTPENEDCTGEIGWVDDALPECGATADLTRCACATRECLECVRAVEPTIQRCR